MTGRLVWSLALAACIATLGSGAVAQEQKLQYEVVTELMKLGCQPLSVQPGSGEVQAVVALNCANAGLGKEPVMERMAPLVLCNAYKTPEPRILVTTTATCWMIR